jgi:hypothetical protein
MEQTFLKESLVLAMTTIPPKVVHTLPVKFIGFPKAYETITAGKLLVAKTFSPTVDKVPAIFGPVIIRQDALTMWILLSIHLSTIQRCNWHGEGSIQEFANRKDRKYHSIVPGSLG